MDFSESCMANCSGHALLFQSIDGIGIPLPEMSYTTRIATTRPLMRLGSRYEKLKLTLRRQSTNIRFGLGVLTGAGSVPILDIASTAAFDRLEAQSHSRWSHIIDNGIQPGEFIGGQFFRPTLHKPFSLSETSAGYVIGSCFAQQVQFALGRRRVPLRSSILDSPTESWFLQDGKDNWPLHFFHRFNPGSLLQEFEHILSESPTIANGALIFERPDGLFSDCHYNAR